ncbi:GNAT family N-acetyltransferase [Maricaulis parjimensis]|uniref:GNAT family N-acetyltransferase n=1 Tax=Maricaulis parjimensis TaxID=144023 RepID=UPI001939FDFC|nr:GNAT family N-acetyltransferase [Maricaulis parjimensis]
MGPRIETERCLLRLPEMADAPAVSLYCGDYDVAKNTARIPHPYPALGAEMWVLMTRASWKPQGNQSLTVEHAGEVIGGGGVFKRTPSSQWEIGYWIGKPWWGKGFATEIGQALVDLGTKTLGATRLTAAHADDNPASGRVLEKLGFAYTGETGEHFSMARMGQTRCLAMEWAGAA